MRFRHSTRVLGILISAVMICPILIASPLTWGGGEEDVLVVVEDDGEEQVGQQENSDAEVYPKVNSRFSVNLVERD